MTARSIAATMVEGAASSATLAPSPSPSSSPSPSAPPPSGAPSTTSSRRPLWVVGALVAVALGALAFALATRDEVEPQLDEPPVAARPAPADEVTRTASPVPTPSPGPGPASPSASATSAAPDTGPGPGKPPSRSPRRRPNEAPAAPPASIGPPARLEINASPWAQVRVIGRAERCAETPCSLSLPPGSYTLELENPVAGVGIRRAVTVKGGETARIVETLTRPL